MRVLLAAEKELGIDLPIIINGLNKICKHITFYVGKNDFKIDSEYVSFPESYESLNSVLLEETEEYDYSFLLTEKQYDNNYFFESIKNKVIISYSGWEYLTTLSKNNGVVFFIADLIALKIDNSHRHDDTTGCIYDFGWNKSAIDLEMRNAFICSSCLSRITSKKLSEQDSNLFIDLREILNILGNTSKWDQNIADYFRNNNKTKTDKIKEHLTSEKHDVFLAHNTEDKPQIEIICSKLRQKGLNPWLDKEQIPPGRWFQDVIQDTIKKISSAAIFISNNGLGRWQVVELRSFISQCVDRKIPVIPVLLPGVDKIPDEFLFLKEFSWVKFKTDINDEDSIDNLIWGITGRHPKKN